MTDREKELSDILIKTQQEFIALLKLHIKLIDDKGTQLQNEVSMLRTHYEELYKKHQELVTMKSGGEGALHNSQIV